MLIKQNLHVHCTYCDGKDTPEEILESAIEQGFDSIGFSSHSAIYMPRFNTDGKYPNRYREHINRLKKEYADRIKVFLGIEIEITNDFCDLDEYDYLIGTVHYFNLNGKIVGFDRSAETVKAVIDEHFGGDGLKFAKKYYEDLARLPEYADFDIIGHFDIITKNLEKADLFDTSSKEYRNYAIEAAEALSGKIPYFEINTGAISRGYRTTPYPEPFILDELKRLGFGAVISSDCHDRRTLDCYYTEAEELLKAHGFKEIYILTNSGFVPCEL